MVNGLGYSIIGNTSDFGSEITGSSPTEPTNIIQVYYEKSSKDFSICFCLLRTIVRFYS